MKNKNYGIIVHPEDFEDFLSNMTDEEAGAIIKNMIRTFLGEEGIQTFDDRFMSSTSRKMCGRVARDKELSEIKSRVGKMGGAPIGNENAKTTKKQAENNQKTSREQAKTTPNTNTNTNTNINKKQYGECANVLLTEEEYQKIVSAGYTELIDELSLYIDSKGAKYKSHYSTILSWARRREKESKVVPMSGPDAKNQFNRFSQRTDYDFEALEKKLIKN